MNLRLVVGGDLVTRGSLPKEIAHTVGRRLARRGCRAGPVVEVLPFGGPVLELRILQIDGGPELFESSSLHLFDVSVGRSRGVYRSRVTRREGSGSHTLSIRFRGASSGWSRSSLLGIDRVY